jgi:hypothetical protein
VWEEFFEVPHRFFEPRRIVNSDSLNIPYVTGIDLGPLDGGDRDRDRTTSRKCREPPLIRLAQMKDERGSEAMERTGAVSILFDEPDGDACRVWVDIEEPGKHGECPDEKNREHKSKFADR